MASLGSEVGRDDPVESVPLVWLTASLPTPTTNRITRAHRSLCIIYRYLLLYLFIYLSIYSSISHLSIHLKRVDAVTWTRVTRVALETHVTHTHTSLPPAPPPPHTDI